MLANPTLANLARSPQQAAYPSLRQSLVGAWFPALSVQGAGLYDVTGRLNLTNANYGWGVSPAGVGLQLASASAGSRATATPAFKPSGPFCLWAVATLLGTGSGFSNFFAICDSNPVLKFERSDSTTLSIYGNAGGGFRVGSTTTATTGRYFMLCNFSPAAGLQFWLNGSLAYSDTTARTLVYTSTTEVAVGYGNTDGVGRTVNASLHAFGVCSRQLRPSEIRLMNADPFAPIRRKASNPAASAGSALLLERRRRMASAA